MWLRRLAYRGCIVPSLSMPALRARSLVFPEWALSGASRRDIMNEARAFLPPHVLVCQIRWLGASGRWHGFSTMRMRSSKRGCTRF